MFKQIQWAAVFLGIAFIAAALLYKLIVSQTAISETQMIVAICTLGILLFLSSHVDSLESIAFGKEGFRVKLKVLQKKTSENEEAIIDLILGSMGDETYENFKKFARSEGFGPYKKEHHKGLETELYHLRNLGYIKLKEKFHKIPIFDLPESDSQLSDYFLVTETGKKYIELREKYKPKR